MKSSVFGDLEWWKQLEKEEAERKRKELESIKCNKCVWFHKDSLYCPFQTCFRGKWGEY